MRGREPLVAISRAILLAHGLEPRVGPVTGTWGRRPLH
jgi:hypothetical protein